MRCNWEDIALALLILAIVVCAIICHPGVTIQ